MVGAANTTVNGDSLLALDGLALSAMFKRGEISPVEVAEAVLRRAEATAASLNAFCHIEREAVRAQARASEGRWRQGLPLSALDGVPVSVKDNIDVAGAPTRYGSLAARPEPRTSDSPSVARLREAGAVIVGKTCLPEFAHKITTDSPLTGITRNPWKLEHSPGGSSGGAAVAVATGMGPLALGTDGGGSIRVPAAWTGVFGFKPSFGRVPHHPRGAFAPLSHVGPMTRTIADAAMMMTIISQPDPSDWYSLPPEPRRFEEHLSKPLQRVRVALSARLGLDDVQLHPAIAPALEGVAQTLASLGATVTQADPPGIRKLCDAHRVMWATFCARLLRGLGNPPSIASSLRGLAERGEQLPRDAYLEAMLSRGELGARLNLFFQDYDFVLCPVAPTLAPLTDGEPGVPVMTCWCNQSGLPAASMVAGRAASGLPVGVQIVGRRFQDHLVLAASHAVEQQHGQAPLAPTPPVP